MLALVTGSARAEAGRLHHRAVVFSKLGVTPRADAAARTDAPSGLDLTESPG